MGLFDTVKKIIVGDVAHDAADSGKPVGIGGYAKTTAPGPVNADGDRVNAWFDRTGRLFVSEDQLRALLPASLGGKASAASLAVTLATDQTAADNGDPATRTVGLGATYQDLTNSPTSEVGADKAGWLRMTQQRELLVSSRARWAYADATTVTYIADVTYSVTSAYQTFGAITAGILGGDGMDANPLWIRIPMLEQFRGVTVGVYHNLGVNLTVAALADITGHTAAATVNRPQIDTVTMASGAFTWFASFPLADGANASMRYVPMLNMPMRYLVLVLTPASNPASGQVILSVAR